MPEVGVLAAVLHPHRRADPLAAGQLRRGHLDLGGLVAAVRLRGPDVACGCARAVPTACDEIVSPPSLIAVQFAPAPRSARLKSSRPAGAGFAAQVTATLVTLAEPIVPVPLATAQVWPGRVGLDRHAVGGPAASLVAKVNAPLARHASGRRRRCPAAPPSRTAPRPSRRPSTSALAVQVTATLVTLAEPTVPARWPPCRSGPAGLVLTVTP